MGDIGHGEFQSLLQATDLFTHVAAQTRVQVAQGFIKQQDARLQDQGACQSHALLLASRQLAGQAVVVADQTHIAQGFHSTPLCLGFFDT